MDKISLTSLEIFAHHGVFDFEKENGQTFILDCTCALDTRPAGTTDNLAASLDYGALAKRLIDDMSGGSRTTMLTLGAPFTGYLIR